MPRNLSKTNADKIYNLIAKELLPVQDAIICSGLTIGEFKKHIKRGTLRDTLLSAIAERKRKLIKGMLEEKPGYQFLLERYHSSEFAKPGVSERLGKKDRSGLNEFESLDFDGSDLIGEEEKEEEKHEIDPEFLGLGDFDGYEDD